MSWRPSEGLKRAEVIVRGLIADSLTADLELRDGVFTHHVIAVLGKELDQALSDGAAQDANAVIGNRRIDTDHQNPDGSLRPPHGAFEHQAYGVKPDGNLGIMTREEYAAAIGVVLPDFPADQGPLGEPLERMPEDDVARSLAIKAAEQGAIDAFGPAPKKKRGRPKGSKGRKKAKKATAVPTEAADSPAEAGTSEAAGETAPQ